MARIAPPPTKDHIPSGSTHWITGDRSREVVQELRHAADAILHRHWHHSER